MAAELGFSSCGISKAQKLEQDAQRLEHYLQNGYQGKMSYLENHFELRIDPRLLVPGAKSVVSLLYNYFPKQKQKEGLPQISKYAYGEDYHVVIREKLKNLFYRLEEKVGMIEGRVFVDSAPILEKTWAAKSGLGWIGKHSNFVTRQQGSFFFLAEIILDLELEYDSPVSDFCGTCTRCIDACPTEAILPNKVLDASKCISYLTIELRDAIPEQFNGTSNGWVFGCDICQDVCPWNRFSKTHNEPRFLINELMMNKTDNDWSEMSEEVFKELYHHSPIKRTRLEGMKRNVRWYKSKKAE